MRGHVRRGKRHAVALEPGERGERDPADAPRPRPIASTIASAGSVSPSTVTLAPPWSGDVTRSTTPVRSVAPRARAASTSAVVKRAGWDLRRRLRRAEPLGDDGRPVDPARRRRNAMAACYPALLARREHVGVHAAVPVVGAELLRERGVEREAQARQRADRRAVAPVEGQEAAGLARRRARHAGTLHHRDRHAAARKVVGDRGAHDAGAADDDVTRRSHGWSAGQGSTIARRSQGGRPIGPTAGKSRGGAVSAAASLWIPEGHLDYGRTSRNAWVITP